MIDKAKQWTVTNSLGRTMGWYPSEAEATAAARSIIGTNAAGVVVNPPESKSKAKPAKKRAKK